MDGIIDIVVNLFTPQEVELGQTGLDEDFKKQVRMPEEMRSGVTIDQYLVKMDHAGIEKSQPGVLPGCPGRRWSEVPG